MRARFLEGLGIANYSERTRETMINRLRPFFHFCCERGVTRPRDVTRALIERFQAWQFHYRKDDGNPLDASTQKLVISSVKLYFGWLAKRDILPFNPASEIEYPKTGFRLPKAILAHEEVELVLAQPDARTVLGLRDRAILETLYSTGLRRIEAAALAVSDLDQNAATVLVRKGKGDRDRLVPIGERALIWVQKYLADSRSALVRDPTEPALFVNTYGRALHKRDYTSLGRKYWRKANIDKPGSVHIFRHSMATAMLEGGADVRVIQEMLGHVSLLSTQIYTHVSIAKLKAVHAATHPAASFERKEHADGEPAPLDLDSPNA